MRVVIAEDLALLRDGPFSDWMASARSAKLRDSSPCPVLSATTAAFQLAATVARSVPSMSAALSTSAENWRARIRSPL